MASAPTIFTAHAVTDGSSDSLRFVPHGFAWAAFWFGPFWLLRHALWIRAGVMFALGVAVVAAIRIGAIGANGALVVWLLVSAFIGVEAQEWRRRALQRRGAAIVGFGCGVDEADAWARAAFREKVAERAAP